MLVNKPFSNKTRLRWGCRRGMLELDLLLLPFFEAKFDGFSPQEQENFAQMLEEPDQDLYAWILKVNTCQQPKFDFILSEIRQYHAIP